MNKILDKLKNTRLLASIGVICMIFGTIFPYVSFNLFGYHYNISLWGFWEGKLLLVIIIANLLFIFEDFVEKYIPSLFNTTIGRKLKNINNAKASLIPTILGAAFAIYLTVKLDVSFSDYSFGFYSLWIGVICLVVYAILHKNNDKIQMKM